MFSASFFFSAKYMQKAMAGMRGLWYTIIIINCSNTAVKERTVTVGRLKRFCSIILVILIPVLILTLSINVVFRVPDAYLFHFNDSQSVDQLYVSLTNSEMADAISSFMNKFYPYPEEFQVEEDTGYDWIGIFDSRDSYNMLVLKRALDISGIFCIVSLILTAAIHVLLIREGEKKALRNSFRVGAAISLVLIGVQAFVVSAGYVRDGLLRLLGTRTPAEGSNLEIILGDDFWGVVVVFLTGISLVVFGVCTYVNHRLTRPPRIFF